MKKIVAAVLGLTMIVGAAAPALAVSNDNCPFTDSALCVSESLVVSED